MAPTRNASHPPEKDPAHIPRPPNCFILYRADKLAQFREARKVPGCSPRDTRALISKMWQEEPEEVVEYWRRVAEQKAAEHREAYPNYKYQPKRKKRTTAAVQGYAKAGTGVGQNTDVPLLPVPTLVPSSIVDEDEGCEVGTTPLPKNLSSQPAQSCTIISPSFIRPSPNFSFLTLDDPSTSTTTYDTSSHTPEISLPNVPSIQSQSSSMHTPLFARPTDLRARQPFQTDFASFSSDPVFTQSPNYTVPGANTRYPQMFATSMQNDTEMAPPTVPSQDVAPWIPNSEVHGVESGLSAEDPATSVFGHAVTDNCLLDMVSSLLFLPENVLSNFYF